MAVINGRHKQRALFWVNQFRFYLKMVGVSRKTAVVLVDCRWLLALSRIYSTHPTSPLSPIRLLPYPNGSGGPALSLRDWGKAKSLVASSYNLVKRSGRTPWLTTLKNPNSSQALTIWVLAVGSVKSRTGIITGLVLNFGTGCNKTTMVCFFLSLYVRNERLLKGKTLKGEGTWWKGCLLIECLKSKKVVCLALIYSCLCVVPMILIYFIPKISVLVFIMHFIFFLVDIILKYNLYILIKGRIQCKYIIFEKI